MVGSVTEAEDLVQETFLKAWRALDRFEGRTTFRAWLYRIATNTCLDALAHSSRRSVPMSSLADPIAEDPTLQPYPDRLLDELAAQDLDDPAVAVAARETVELTFLGALLHLPPRQRAVLIVRDVLGWTAAETAELLEISVASANSLLQRARATLQQRAPADRDGWRRREVSADDEALLKAYCEAHHASDIGGVLSLLADDVRISMPPDAPLAGVDEVASIYRHLFGPDGPGEWHLVATRANGRPTAACYLRKPGEDVFRATTVDVLTVEDGKVVEVNCFMDGDVFPAFGLPMELTPSEVASGGA
jgi:RNA polymerase sigma-70 factor (ECF subfamily)